MGLNKIMQLGSNISLKITNLFGSIPVSTLEGLPLGSSDGSDTGELGVKVIVIGPGLSEVIGNKTDPKWDGTSVNPSIVSILKKIASP